MSDDSLLEEIAELARDHTGEKTVTLATRLYGDLGMTGDDAHEFLLGFAIKYDVDMGELIWLRYFDDEGTANDLMGPAIALAASVLSPAFAVRWQAAREAEREIDIAHLAEVARVKRWINPGEAMRRNRRDSPLLLLFSAATLLVMAFFVILGVVVAHGLLTRQLGQRDVLPLVGIVAASVLPLFFALNSWRAIERKLASA